MDRRHFVRVAALGGALGATRTLHADPTDAKTPPRASNDVRAFGAVGDGKTDDTDAIVRALKESPGAIGFSAGTYRVTRPIEVDLSSTGHRALEGDGSAVVLADLDGPAFHFRGTHAGTADPGSVLPGVWNRERLPLVSGVEIRGAHEKAIGLRLEGTMQASLSHLLIRRCRIGVHLTRRNRNLVVSECHIYHNREIGLLFDQVNLHQCVINNNHISYNPRSGLLFRGGELRNIQICGNDIEYNHDPKTGGSADVWFDLTLEGSTFREGTIVGNTIQARPSPGGANVRVVGGPELRTSGLLAITGNLIGSQTDNIHLDRCRGVTVSGNSLYSAERLTALVERSANIVLAGNTIDWNPDHRGKRLTDGVLVRGSDGVSITGMIIENSFRGTKEGGGTIEVVDSRDVTLSECQILDPRHRGIVFDRVKRGRISNCTVIDRRREKSMLASIEIEERFSRDNSISGNTVQRGSLRIPAGVGTVVGTLEVDA